MRRRHIRAPEGLPDSGEPRVRGWRLWLVIPKEVVTEFYRRGLMHWGASAAFYALISLPPLLILLASVGGLFVPSANVGDSLVARLAPLLSPQGIDLVDEVVTEMSEIGFSSVRAVPSILLLLVSGTAVFINLQTALNEIWDVEPEGSALLSVLRARLVSLLTAGTLGAVLFLSFLFTTLVQGLTRLSAGTLLESAGLIRLLDPVASLLIYCVLFTLLFRILPDARVEWRDVLAGGCVTGLLFLAGKEALAFYLTHSDAGSPYGAASSVFVFLLWIYYSVQLVFLGAVFTRVWSRHRGRAILSRS